METPILAAQPERNVLSSGHPAVAGLELCAAEQFTVSIGSQNGTCEDGIELV